MAGAGVVTTMQSNNSLNQQKIRKPSSGADNNSNSKLTPKLVQKKGKTVGQKLKSNNTS